MDTGRNLLLTEDYVCYAAGFMRPHVSIGPYGYDPENGRVLNILGSLMIIFYRYNNIIIQL